MGATAMATKKDKEGRGRCVSGGSGCRALIVRLIGVVVAGRGSKRAENSAKVRGHHTMTAANGAAVLRLTLLLAGESGRQVSVAGEVAVVGLSPIAWERGETI